MQLFFLYILLSILSFGCKSVPSHQGTASLQHERVKKVSQAIVPVGKIVWINSEKQQAVVYISPRYCKNADFKQPLITYNENFVLKATYSPLDLQRGSSLAVSVFSGKPDLGDVVTTLLSTPNGH